MQMKGIGGSFFFKTDNLEAFSRVFFSCSTVSMLDEICLSRQDTVRIRGFVDLQGSSVGFSLVSAAPSALWSGRC